MNNLLTITCCLITTSLLLFASCGGSEVIGTLGGSEVVGKLSRENNQPIGNLEVKALIISGVDSTKLDTTLVQTTVTDTKGSFTFTELPVDQYTLYARYPDDSLILPKVTFIPDTSKQVDLKTIIMRVPGAIKGRVNRDGISPSTPIFCGIPGTSHYAIADSSGNFTISLIEPEKTYSIEILCSGYLKQTFDNLQVTSGDTTQINDVATLKIDPAGAIPAPTGLTYGYDSLLGKAIISWKSVKASDVHRYTVFLKDAQNTPKLTTSDTVCTMMVFSDNVDTMPHEVSFQVAALDDDNNEGSKSNIITFIATPPSWFAITVQLTKGTPDSTSSDLPVILTFSSRKGVVDTAIWSIGHPDSVVQKQSYTHLSQGSDTLLWPSTILKSRLFITLKNENRVIHFDSIDASSFNPIDTWKQLDSLLEKRRYAGSCVVEGIIYVFGGAKENLSMSGTPTLTGLKTAEKFDPATGKWTKIAPLTFARQKAAFAALNGKIYVMGGTSGTIDHRSVEMYDPSTDKWTITDSLPKTLIGASACVFNNRILLTGGMSGTLTDAHLVSDITAYDPAAKKWEQLGTLALPRQLHSSLVNDNCIITMGGIGYDSTESSAIEALLIESFPLNDAGTIQSFSLTTGFFGAGVAAVDNKMYIFGGVWGVTVTDLPQNSLNMISLQDQTITTLQPLPLPLDGVSVVTLNNSIFMIGGSTPGTPVPKSTKGVYVYYP